MAARPGELTLDIKRLFPATRSVVFEVFINPVELVKW